MIFLEKRLRISLYGGVILFFIGLTGVFAGVAMRAVATAIARAFTPFFSDIRRNRDADDYCRAGDYQ